MKNQPSQKNQHPAEATTPQKPKYLVVEDRGYSGKVIRFRTHSKYVVIAIIRQKPSTARTRVKDLERYQSEYINQFKDSQHSNNGGAYAQLCQALEDIKAPYTLEIQKPYKELIDKILINDQKQKIKDYLQYLVTETNREHQKALKDLVKVGVNKALDEHFSLSRVETVVEIASEQAKEKTDQEIIINHK